MRSVEWLCAKKETFCGLKKKYNRNSKLDGMVFNWFEMEFFLSRSDQRWTWRLFIVGFPADVYSIWKFIMTMISMTNWMWFK